MGGPYFKDWDRDTDNVTCRSTYQQAKGTKDHQQSPRCEGRGREQILHGALRWKHLANSSILDFWHQEPRDRSFCSNVPPACYGSHRRLTARGMVHTLGTGPEHDPRRKADAAFHDAVPCDGRSPDPVPAELASTGWKQQPFLLQLSSQGSQDYHEDHRGQRPQRLPAPS